MTTNRDEALRDCAAIHAEQELKSRHDWYAIAQERGARILEMSNKLLAADMTLTAERSATDLATKSLRGQLIALTRAKEEMEARMSEEAEELRKKLELAKLSDIELLRTKESLLLDIRNLRDIASRLQSELKEARRVGTDWKRTAEQCVRAPAPPPVIEEEENPCHCAERRALRMFGTWLRKFARANAGTRGQQWAAGIRDAATLTGCKRWWAPQIDPIPDSEIPACPRA